MVSSSVGARGYTRSTMALEDLDPEQASLAQLMSDLSEEAYFAGWILGNEYMLWRAVLEGPSRFGQLELSESQVRRLRDLSSRCSGWIFYDPSRAESWAPLWFWHAAYARHISDDATLSFAPPEVWIELPTGGLCSVFAIPESDHSIRLRSTPLRAVDPMASPRFNDLCEVEPGSSFLRLRSIRQRSSWPCGAWTVTDAEFRSIEFRRLLTEAECSGALWERRPCGTVWLHFPDPSWNPARPFDGPPRRPLEQEAIE